MTLSSYTIEFDLKCIAFVPRREDSSGGDRFPKKSLLRGKFLVWLSTHTLFRSCGGRAIERERIKKNASIGHF